MDQGITETIGVDLGDRYSTYCVLDHGTGEERERGRLRTTPTAFEGFFRGRSGARTVVEVGTHSPWVSRILQRHCAEVHVANARELHFIFRNLRKGDDKDPERLARVGRMDPKLLRPIQHRSQERQHDLVRIRARAALVSTRTELVNTLRGLVKSVGGRLPRKDASAIRHDFCKELPAQLHDALAPLVLTIEFLNDEIKRYDRKIEEVAKSEYPETRVLTQVDSVGTLTALTFLLTLEDPNRFAHSRDVGPFLGVTPKRDQSGEVDKQLRITKAGDAALRTLLVQCAQRILGRFGKDCDLKRYGERIAARGGKIAKRKAVIAVARKLAVLLHHLWKTGEIYDPNHNLTTARVA
jgi:transposase